LIRNVLLSTHALVRAVVYIDGDRAMDDALRSTAKLLFIAWQLQMAHMVVLMPL